MAATVKTEYPENNSCKITWETLGDDETGPIAAMARWPNKSFQAFGTFASGVLTLHGSNDGVNFAPLNDLEGNAISMTAAGILSVMEHCMFYRPVVSSAGGPTTDIDCILFGV